MGRNDIWIPESLPCLLSAALQARGLTQTGLADGLQLRQGRISEFLSGARTPGPEHLEPLCQALGLCPRSVIKKTAWQAPARGRPASAADGRLLEAFAPERRYIPPRDRDFAFRMGALRARYGRLLDALAPRLVARPDWPAVQQFLRDAPSDSADEGALYFQALGLGFTTHWLSPLRLAFEELPVVDSISGAPVGHLRRPVLGLHRDSTTVVLVPHVGVRPGGKPYTIDFLVGVMEEERRSWRGLEVDGEGHDPTRDRERRLHIGLEEVRVVPGDLQDPEFGQRLLQVLIGLHRLEARTPARRERCACGRPRLTHPMSIQPGAGGRGAARPVAS